MLSLEKHVGCPSSGASCREQNCLHSQVFRCRQQWPYCEIAGCTTSFDTAQLRLQDSHHGDLPRPSLVHTLATRRVRIAAWQMVSCPNDAKGRRYCEESATWRCDEMWRDEYIKLSKEDYRNSTQWKRPFSWQTELLGTSFHAFLG